MHSANRRSYFRGCERMRELFNAQGFPGDYIIETDANGNPYPKSKQVARCGNAVTPPVATALVRANLPEYCDLAA